MAIPADSAVRISLLLSVLVVSVIGTDVLTDRTPAGPTPRKLVEFPYKLSGWVGEDKIIPNAVLSKLGVDDYLMREYNLGKSGFWLYIGYYRSQKGSKTIHSPKHCYPAAGWEKIESSIIPFKVPGKQGIEETITVNRYLLGKDMERELVYYWYQTGDIAEASESLVLLNRMRNALLGRRTDGALIRLSTRIREGNTPEEERIMESIPLIYSIMSRNFPM